ncbi:MAG: hypothetical protein FWF12_02610 [Betaproteobacteria bacterium]|nr:hypothetical protein [Betaproteobacteria bacterium]
MRPDALTIEIRARTYWEAIDLGLVLVQAYWRNLYAAWFVVMLPVVFLVLALAYLTDNNWYWVFLPLLWLKPLYDRILLHVMSRAVFGEVDSWRDVLRAMPGLLRQSGLFRALTWGRFTLRRSFMLPVWQLEGIPKQTRNQRFHALKGRGAIWLIIVCVAFEVILFIGMLGLLFMMLPPELAPSDTNDLLYDFVFVGMPFWFKLACGLIFLLTVGIIEPFYVAAGFTLYLNRRTELEGWDIELGFRTLAARLEAQQVAS